MTPTDTYEGKLLIAMPGMGDPRFDRAVVFLCSHGEEGALGLIVNKPAEDLRFSTLLEQLDLGISKPERDIRVHFGGPVENGRGFVLHTPDYTTEDGTIRVGDYGMTGTLDVLEEIARGNGPERAMLALGYAGWAPGQLEEEILGNGWLTADPSTEIVFGDNDDAKWAGALEGMGVDPRLLSGTAGTA